jgi:hypothetical protein
MTPATTPPAITPVFERWEAVEREEGFGVIDIFAASGDWSLPLLLLLSLLSFLMKPLLLDVAVAKV